MANKQYTSIIRLFEHCGIATGEDFNAARARKQLQAEFGIAQEGFIEVDGFVYTRHDVLEEIERPDFTQRLVFHQQLWERPQLLALLEQNSVNVFTVAQDFDPFWSNPEFDAFFSPYFAGPFQYVSRILLGEQKLREMGEWLKYEGFLLPAEREEALRPLRIFLDENLRLLRNVNGGNYELMRPKIEHWLFSSWNILFNNLPHEFYDTRSDIVILLINLTVAIQKTNKKDCRLISDQLIAVTDLEESLRSTIISNHDAYSPTVWTSNRRAIWFVLWIGIMIARTISCNSSDDSDRYRSIDGINFNRSTDTSDMQGLRFSVDTTVGKLPAKEINPQTPLDSILKKNERK